MPDAPKEISAWITADKGAMGLPSGEWNSVMYDPEAVQADRYVLGTEADRIKEERDAIMAAAENMLGLIDDLPTDLEEADELRSAIAACKGKTFG